MMDTITNIISKAVETEAVCPICGSAKEKIEINIGETKRYVWAVTCNCWDKQADERKKRAHKEFLQKKFANANIGKRYENITIEKLAELGTEHVFEASKYIKEFNPKSGNGLHFIGTFGNGKTSLGYAILKKLILKSYNCIFITWTEFVTRCNYARSFDAKETIEQILKWISRFDLVMLDEFVINTRSESEINLACELFDRWYRNNKCYILINNTCDISEMKNVPKLGKLLDRVFEQTQKCMFKHESYRRQNKDN